MVSEKIVIKAKEGLHARPASKIVQFVKGFSSDFKMQCEGKTANCKSIISLLALGAKHESEVEVIAEGENEAAELKSFIEFMENIED